MHRLLRDKQLLDAAMGDPIDVYGGVEPRDCGDYRYASAALLFNVTLDEWNLDAAVHWLSRITSDELRNTRYVEARSGWPSLVEPATQLASRLVACGRTVDARWSLEIAKRMLDAEHLSNPYFPGLLKSTEAAIDGAKRVSVVINHPRQAEHALRLGAIDEKRYRKAMEKFGAAVTKHDAAEQELGRLRESGVTFAELPTDVITRDKRLMADLVPEPAYFVNRVADLTDDQQAEYARTFAEGGPLARIRKYLYVRLTSLLESVVLHPAAVDAAAIQREVDMLAELGVGSARHYAKTITQAIADLSSQPIEERREQHNDLHSRPSGRFAFAAPLSHTRTILRGLIPPPAARRARVSRPALPRSLSPHRREAVRRRVCACAPLANQRPEAA